MTSASRVFRFRRAAVEFLEAEFRLRTSALVDEPRVRRFLAAAKGALETALSWEEVFLAGEVFDLPEGVLEREDFDDFIRRARRAVLAPERPRTRVRTDDHAGPGRPEAEWLTQ